MTQRLQKKANSDIKHPKTFINIGKLQTDSMCTSGCMRVYNLSMLVKSCKDLIDVQAVLPDFVETL